MGAANGKERVSAMSPSATELATEILNVLDSACAACDAAPYNDAGADMKRY